MTVESLFKNITHSGARKKVQVELEKHGAHVQMIEHIYHPGVPDLNVCWRGKEFWIEIKVGRDSISPAQKLWMKPRIEAGGRIYVVKFTQSTNIKVLIMHSGAGRVFMDIAESVMEVSEIIRADLGRPNERRYK